MGQTGSSMWIHLILFFTSGSKWASCSVKSLLPRLLARKVNTMRLKQDSQMFLCLGTEIKPDAGWVASIHDLSQRVSRACLKCIRAPHPPEFLRCLHRDDWRRRKAVLGRGPGWTDEIANLVSSLSHFHSQAVCLQPLRSINKHRCNAFTHRTSQHFPDSFPLFIFSTTVKVVKKTKTKIKVKKRKKKSSKRTKKVWILNKFSRFSGKLGALSDDSESGNGQLWAAFFILFTGLFFCSECYAFCSENSKLNIKINWLISGKWFNFSQRWKTNVNVCSHGQANEEFVQ